MKAKLSRRAVLQGAAALPFAFRSLAEKPIESRWLLLGTDKGAGIYRASWDSATGTIGESVLAAKAAHPTWLAMHPALPVLYSGNEADDQTRAGVSVFAVDVASATLTLRQNLDADAPCHLSVLPGARALVSSCYGAGTVWTHAMSSDGSLQTGTRWHGDNSAHGPDAGRQRASHPHMCGVTPDQRHMIMLDLGDDAVNVVPLSIEGQPALEKLRTIKAAPGSGPRHVAFHGNGRWMYVIHEMACSLTLYDWDGEHATLRPGSAVSTIDTPPQTHADGITDGASEVTVLGNVLYAATRGVDKMAVFAIDPESGRLRRIQLLPSGGRIPRHFAISPDGRWAVIANQGTDVAGTANLAVYRRAADGTLSDLKTYAAKTPMFVQFV